LDRIFFGSAVIDERPRQIEHSGHPGDQPRRCAPSPTIAIATFQLFFGASASQASRIFFTSVADEHGFDRSFRELLFFMALA
jgi:hypothetical protein